MATKNSVKAIPVLSFDAATLLPAAWQAITPVDGLAAACFMLIFRNVSNRLVLVSYNGIDTHDVVPPDSTVELEFQTNSLPNNNCSLMPNGTNIYLAGAVGGAGHVYLSGYFQENQ